MVFVFVKSCDLEHGGAYRCRFKHTARVRHAYEPGRIVIGVIHIDNNTHKVPLYWDVLVSNLEKKSLERDRQDRGGRKKSSDRQEREAPYGIINPLIVT